MGKRKEKSKLELELISEVSMFVNDMIRKPKQRLTAEYIDKKEDDLIKTLNNILEELFKEELKESDEFILKKVRAENLSKRVIKLCNDIELLELKKKSLRHKIKLEIKRKGSLMAQIELLREAYERKKQKGKSNESV